MLRYVTDRKGKGSIRVSFPLPLQKSGTQIQDLTSSGQILKCCTWYPEFGGGDAGEIFVCRECKLTFAKDISEF